ncbi:MAG: bifunctional folylpolyglutamate synthase/dihydrofolate synthase [Solirubrobacterales bacterium]|nr:bifunctional folylpolyglutamate synthase/dihydrofolate synthase [Solirubrobacterales bacterium]
MHRLTSVLGMPQHRFASIHVVGTNGKSSVTRMAAALLEAHGVSAGACVSPHAVRWSERVLIGGEEIGAAEFAAAVERAARAAEVVDRSLEEGEAVTQFELATAAAFVALAAARVEVGVIEAGLGGRLDATNTIPSRVTVLTSVGLDHTKWLGATEAEIAAEKLAVLRDHSTLALGRVGPGVAALAERTAGQRGARLVQAPEDPGAGLRLRAPGRFQRRNFALARAAAEAFLGELDPGRVAEVAATLSIPGRLERVSGDPPALVDAAHNADGAAALAEALPELAGGRPVVACLAILRDKDAGAMVRALAPALQRAVCTELPTAALYARGLPAAASCSAGELADACATAGLPAEAEPSFVEALRRGRALASEPPGGMLLVTGSHYVLAPARASLRLCED